MLGFTIILITIVYFGLRTYMSIDREYNFYLENSELHNPKFYDLIEEQYNTDPQQARRDKGLYPVFAHRVVQGTGTIIGYRFFSMGEIDTIDDESYEKLTVWINGKLSLKSDTFTIGNNTKVISIKGGSAWPRRACAGNIEKGVVTIKKKDFEIEVNVKGRFKPLNIISMSYCDEKDVNKTFLAKSIEYENLSYKQGKPGNHVYDETY